MSKAKPAVKSPRSKSTAKATRTAASGVDAAKTARGGSSLVRASSKTRPAQESKAQAKTGRAAAAKQAATSTVRQSAVPRKASTKAAGSKQVTRTTRLTKTTQRRANQTARPLTVGKQSAVKAPATRKVNAPARKQGSQPTLADRAYAALSRAGRPMTGTALAKRLRVSTTSIGPTLAALNRTRRAAKQIDGSWTAL